MRRVLKTNGSLIIGEGYAVIPFRWLLNLFFHVGNTGDYHSYGKGGFKRLLAKNKFKDIHIVRRGMKLFVEAKA